REDLDELVEEVVPLVEDAAADRRARALHVLLHEVADLDDVALVERLELVEHRRVDAAAGRARLVEDEPQPAAPSGGGVAPRAAEPADAPAGHVLAAVVADALDDGVRARVAHGEALARAAAEERAPGRRAVEDGVADDDLLLGAERHVRGREDGEDAAAQA